MTQVGILNLGGEDPTQNAPSDFFVDNFQAAEISLPEKESERFILHEGVQDKSYAGTPPSSYPDEVKGISMFIMLRLIRMSFIHPIRID
ncbi:MAG: hypothetical protein GKR87_05480 [Kiritimatiellae bacterium]|nr:hypothetical protein [Kiritimatiellia bacterium]